MIYNYLDIMRRTPGLQDRSFCYIIIRTTARSVSLEEFKYVV